MPDYRNLYQQSDSDSDGMQNPDQGDQNEPETPQQPPQEAEALRRQLGQLSDMGSVTTDNGKHIIHCLTIIGQIEGHYILPSNNKTTKYEHLIPQLVAIEESPVIEGLLIILNTVGGDIEAGLALAELIAGMKKPTVSLVLGGGHSIGVPLAIAAKRSFIAETATMTLHPVRMTGLMLGVPQAFSYFQRMQERISGFVAQNSNMSQERFVELCMITDELVLDIGSVLEGERAVSEGLIDELGTLSGAIGALYSMIEADKQKNAEQNQ